MGTSDHKEHWSAKSHRDSRHAQGDWGDRDVNKRRRGEGGGRERGGDSPHDFKEQNKGQERRVIFANRLWSYQCKIDSIIYVCCTYHIVFQIIICRGNISIKLSCPEEDVLVQQGHFRPVKSWQFQSSGLNLISPDETEERRYQCCLPVDPLWHVLKRKNISQEEFESVPQTVALLVGITVGWNNHILGLNTYIFGDKIWEWEPGLGFA